MWLRHLHPANPRAPTRPRPHRVPASRAGSTAPPHSTAAVKSLHRRQRKTPTPTIITRISLASVEPCRHPRPTGSDSRSSRRASTTTSWPTTWPSCWGTRPPRCCHRGFPRSRARRDAGRRHARLQNGLHHEARSHGEGAAPELRPAGGAGTPRAPSQLLNLRCYLMLEAAVPARKGHRRYKSTSPTLTQAPQNGKIAHAGASWADGDRRRGDLENT